MSEIIINENSIKEIINGRIFYMMPGTSVHEKAVTRIGHEFYFYFRSHNKNCEVYSEGLAVYLDDENSNYYVVPDISIICDDSKFSKLGYKGVPELIVEVISVSTAKKDKLDKFKAYEKAGVKEYWIVSTKEKSIDQYVLENDQYTLKNIVTLADEADFDKLTDEQKMNYTSIIKPFIFEDLEIDLRNIFY